MQAIARESKVGKPTALSLANESQFLLVSTESMNEVCMYVCMYVCICSNHTQITKRLDSESGEVGIDRFRGNIIVRGGAPYDEDSWKRVVIQGQHLTVLGPCTRCQMICVNPSSGERTNEPLRTLATFRRESVCMHRAVCTSYQSINYRAGCCSGSIWRMMCMLRLVRLSFPSARK